VALELPREAARGRAEQMLIEGLLQVGITPVEPQ
jgi:hypothetical protein